MASYTSSFEAPTPIFKWTRLFCGALAMLVVYVGLSEVILSARGFGPTVHDTEALWLKERERAAVLGDRALILIGASRVQLGFDLNALREMTGLEPVQLAIDGSSYIPVLQGLANDPAIRGTVILDLMPGPVSFDAIPSGASQHYQNAHDALVSAKFRWPTYLSLDGWIAVGIRNRLVNYADGGRPLESLFNRIANSDATPQYLLTFGDRSRKADYQRVAMPEFYLSRVLRHVGNPPEIDPQLKNEDLSRQLADYIRRLKPLAERAQTKNGLDNLESAVAAIQTRGGRVFLLAMPTSGMVQEADSRRFPKELYWDKVVASTTAHAIHWQDHQSLSGFTCPDGSHLDKRDTVAFTKAFVSVAGLNRSQI